MHSTIILIGPMSAGKSTLAQLLAERLDLPRYEVDDFRWDYYAEIGYDAAAAAQIAEAEGMMGLIRHWKPFEAHAVERMLAEHHDGIIDFGAGHSVYQDAALFARVQAALEPYSNVVLVLPSPDPDESIAVVNARFADLLAREVGQVDPALLDLNAHFVRHPSNRALAKLVIYTAGKTPQQCCDEIIARLALAGPQDTP